jgi:hypothetical protein
MHQALINDNRVRPVVWLLASAAAQVIAFWYPSYVAHKYPYTDGDSRYFLVPSLIFSAGLVAAGSALLVARRLGGHSRLSSAGVATLSALASAIAIVPSGIILLRMLSR